MSDTAASATFEVRTRHTDLVKVRALFPADAEGHALAGPFPAVVFIQGGAVGTQRYLWQAQALAEAGYVVALPEHPLDLAFFAIDNGLAARELLVNPPQTSVLGGLVDSQRLAVGGHSLGGVVAAKVALQADFKALLFEASYPDSADENAVPFFQGPVGSFAGKNDCSASLEQVQHGYQVVASPAVLAVFAGVTHYQFTDSDAEDVSTGCQSGVDLGTAHARLTQGLVSFFGAALSATPSTGAAELARIEGVEVTSK